MPNATPNVANGPVVVVLRRFGVYDKRGVGAPILGAAKIFAALPMRAAKAHPTHP